MVDCFVDTLAKPLLDEKAKKPFATQGDVEAVAQMDTLTDTLAEAEAVILSDTPGEVEAEAFV